MRVFVTGATGFVGRALILRLCRDGHTPVAWVRSAQRARALLGRETEWIEASGGTSALRQGVQGCEAVVNLAGEPIIGKRWTAAQKQALVDSRVQLTQDLVAAIEAASPRPKVLVSASAVGYYGSRGSTELTEASPAAGDFLAGVCQEWEAAARRAESFGVRVVSPRIGLVLGHEGGVLAKLLPIFEMGLGGPLGNGKQMMPWIHVHDLVEAMVQALTDEQFRGPFNAVAPNPVSNGAFTDILASAVGRPTLLPVPKLALRAALGEAAQATLASQNALPRRLQDWHFAFQYPTAQEAFANLLDPTAVSISPLNDRSPTPLKEDPYLNERRPRYLLQALTDLPRPPDAVFPFFCRAENLGLMTPSSMALTPVAAPPEAMEVGTSIDYTLSVLGVPLTWRTRIAHWEAPRCFVDTQQKGPYRAWWHEHHFDPSSNDGTRMVDRVFYTPPFGPIGAMAQAAVIERQLRHIFWYRASAITLRFGKA